MSWTICNSNSCSVCVSCAHSVSPWNIQPLLTLLAHCHCYHSLCRHYSFIHYSSTVSIRRSVRRVRVERRRMWVSDNRKKDFGKWQLQRVDFLLEFCLRMFDCHFIQMYITQSIVSFRGCCPKTRQIINSEQTESIRNYLFVCPWNAKRSRCIFGTRHKAFVLWFAFGNYTNYVMQWPRAIREIFFGPSADVERPDRTKLIFN